MPRIEGAKLYILQMRLELIRYCKDMGFNNEDIGELFHLDRSSVARILKSGYKQLKRGKKAVRSM